MQALPLATVFGATGRQEGGVARALPANGRWRVRAVTRRTDGLQARRLASLGTERCTADLDQPVSLPATLVGAHRLFAVTDFWDHLDGPAAQRRIGLAGECLSGAEMTARFAEALGEPVRRADVPLPDLAARHDCLLHLSHHP